MIKITKNNLDFFIKILREEISNKISNPILKEYVNYMTEIQILKLFLSKEGVNPKFKNNILLDWKIIAEFEGMSGTETFKEMLKWKSELVKIMKRLIELEAKIDKGTASEAEKKLFEELTKESKVIGSKFNYFKDLVKKGIRNKPSFGKSFSNPNLRRYFSRSDKWIVMYIVLMVSSASFRYYKLYFSKWARACKKFKPDGDRWYTCTLTAKIKALNEQINFLNTKKNLCEKTKDPKKCLQKIDEKISKLKIKIAENERKLP